MLSIPKDIVKKIEKILYKFVWNGRDRISRNALIGDIMDGGMKMIDVNSHFEAIKAAWIPRIMSSASKLWTKIPKTYINLFGASELILKMSFNDLTMLPVIHSIPSFYQECIVAF